MDVLVGGGEKIVDVKDLAGAGVAFVVEDDVVGAHHLLFGAELVGHAGFELGTGGVVAQLQTAQPLLFLEIDADDLVHQAVEAVFIDYRAFEQDIRGIGMLRRKADEVVPHARVDQGVEPLQHGGVGEDNGGDGLLVNGAIGMEDPVAKEVAYLRQESGVGIIGSRHFVGHKTRDAKFAEFIEDRGLSTSYTASEGYKQRG